MPEPFALQLLRLTAFLAPGSQVPRGLTELLSGTVPVETRTRRDPAGVQATDEFATLDRKRALRVIYTPTRVDVVVSPSREEEGAAPIATIGALEDAREVVAKVATVLSSPTTSTTRLAFGCMLVHEVPNERAALSFLREHLRAVQIDDTGSRDLMYRVNRPRPSLVDVGRLINRLARWEVVRVSIVPLHDGMTMQPAPDARLRGDFLAARVELDINTDAENVTPVPPERVPALADELVREAVRINREGDVP